MDFSLMLSPESTVKSVPVIAPRYQYLFCDLLTDQLIYNAPLTGVNFDRRLSRTGEFRATWTIPNREQAQMADTLSRMCGRLALWVIRDRAIWWGGIVWNMPPTVNARGADSVAIQAATFDSYPDRRFIDNDWFADDTIDAAYWVQNIWEIMQAQSYSDIGVLVEYDNIDNLANFWLDKNYRKADMITHGQMIQDHTDASPGVDYTIDVYYDADQARTKKVRTAGSFALIDEDTRFLIGGYRLPAWTGARDATGTGTMFRTQSDGEQNNVGEDQEPLMSIDVFSLLVEEGWPRLDHVESVDGVTSIAELNRLAAGNMERLSGIKDINSYEVYLRGSDWHPNNIGQYVNLKFSQKDLWYPGQTKRVRPVVASVTPPEGGQQERVKFTMDEESA